VFCVFCGKEFLLSYLGGLALAGLPCPSISNARPLLQTGNPAKLFVEEPGWEPCRQKVTLRAPIQIFCGDNRARPSGAPKRFT
jgi:hypothetical protein